MTTINSVRHWNCFSQPSNLKWKLWDYNGLKVLEPQECSPRKEVLQKGSSTGLWLKVPCRGLARATSSSRTACQNSVVLLELWGLTLPDFGGPFVNLEGVSSCSLLKVSSCVLETLQITAEIMQRDPSQDSVPVQGSTLFLFYQVLIRTS